MASETVNLTVNDGASPVPGVKATLITSSGGVMSALTNGSGVASFAASVLPGVCVVHLEKKGYRWEGGTITVPDSGGVTPYAVTKSLVNLSITDPSGVTYCTVYGFFSGPKDIQLFIEIGGAGETGWIEPTSKGSAIDPAPVYQSGEIRSIRIDDDGSWRIDLPRGVFCRIYAHSPRWSKTFRVPQQDAVAIKDLRAWLLGQDNISLSEGVGTNFSDGNGAVS